VPRNLAVVERSYHLSRSEGSSLVSVSTTSLECSVLKCGQATQRTIHLTTLQNATFQTGSTQADKTCSPRSARDGMTPLPRLKLRGTNCTLLVPLERANLSHWTIYVSITKVIYARKIRIFQRHKSLRHYATSRKVAGSNSDEVIGFFSWPNTSSRTVALGLTQPLTGINTGNLGAKGGRQVRLTISLPSVSRLSAENMGASTSHNLMGFHALLQG
jgi:hypothetical protein